MRIADYRARWQEKPVLRAIYRDFRDRMLAQCAPGSLLEIGGGAIDARFDRANTLVTDIQFAPWLDIVADAQQLPFCAGSFDNIVMMDVLHHLECPAAFFAEAARVLRPKGRVVMLEPAMTPLARVFYSRFHEEPVDFLVDPLAIETPSQGRDPYDANQAVPWLIFGTHRRRFERMFPLLSVRSSTLLSLAAYPLSGGFKSWSLLPNFLLRPLISLEDRLLPVVGSLAAFRMLVVVERHCASAPNT